MDMMNPKSKILKVNHEYARRKHIFVLTEFHGARLQKCTKIGLHQTALPSGNNPNIDPLCSNTNARH